MYEWDREQQIKLGRLAVARREYHNELAAELRPDDQLDEIGWQIFGYLTMRGVAAREARRQALDGRLKKRIEVRDDLAMRDGREEALRWRTLYPSRTDLSLQLESAKEHTEFWRSRFTKPDLVYFVQHGRTGPVKIGHSNDVVKRLATHQTSNPRELHLRAVVPGGRQLERALHQRFAVARMPRGEWFDGEWLAVVLAYGAGLAEQALRNFDADGLPTIVGAQVRSASDVRKIRALIRKAVPHPGGAAGVEKELYLSRSELRWHLADMYVTGSEAAYHDAIRQVLGVHYDLNRAPWDQPEPADPTVWLPYPGAVRGTPGKYYEGYSLSGRSVYPK